MDQEHCGHGHRGEPAGGDQQTEPRAGVRGVGEDGGEDDPGGMCSMVTKAREEGTQCCTMVMMVLRYGAGRGCSGTVRCLGGRGSVRWRGTRPSQRCPSRVRRLRHVEGAGVSSASSSPCNAIIPDKMLLAVRSRSRTSGTLTE